MRASPLKNTQKLRAVQAKLVLILGCKDSATTSNGEVLATKLTHKYAPKLGVAQRAKNKKRVKAIHAKIRNTRQDLIHKFTTNLAKTNKIIIIGKLHSKSFTSTKLAKSVYDAGWFEVKRQLTYKCKHAGCYYDEVNESYTTQTCSCCGSRQNSPKGRANLGIREWLCECGVTHDRDVNAAKNILALGLERLAVGIPSL